MSAGSPEWPRFRCICGEIHEGPVLDIGFRRPDPYLRVPESEREARCFDTDDLCVSDESSWFVRGFLALPLQDHDDHAAFGPWIQVSEGDYRQYVDRHDDVRRTETPVFRGTLANEIPVYSTTEGLDVELRISLAESRPDVRVLDRHHPLGRHQSEGLTLRDWFELRHELMGDRYP